MNKLNIFISYSHSNIKYKKKLLIPLKALEQSYNISTWHDGEIIAGKNIDDEVKINLEKANIILLVVTNDFLASHYCIEIELKNAMKKMDKGECVVIPVIFEDSQLSDSMDYFKLNRVPADGRPIVEFKPQSKGCNEAVNLIRKLIDSFFPKCKKKPTNLNNTKIVKATQENVKIKKNIEDKVIKNTPSVVNNLYIDLYKDGKLNQIPIKQDFINSLPQIASSIHIFRVFMSQTLTKSHLRYIKGLKINKVNGSDLEEFRIEQLKLYLMDICSYTRKYITGNTGVRVHFRTSKGDKYVGIIASTGNDSVKDLSTDWTVDLTPIPIYEGLIYYSSKLDAHLIKSLNTKLNRKTNNEKIWKDYMTMTFKKLHDGKVPLISMGISLKNDYIRANNNILKLLAFINFGEIVEYFIYEYYNRCKNSDKDYDLKRILNRI